jgi:transcription antitermination factor NusG
MLKLCDNPPARFPAELDLADTQGRWRIAHTRSRNEKALARALLVWGVPYYLPLYKRRWVRRGRRFETVMPLFPGYVFFSGDDDVRTTVLTTNRVAQVIEVTDQEQFIEELTQIETAVERDATFDPYPGLVRGRRCRVLTGALAGLEGIIESRRRGCRLVLQVTTLGQAVCVEIDADAVEPV